MTRVLGVVLAGGASTRFGSDKSMAILGGESLLMRAIKRATPQVDRLVLSVGGAASPVPNMVAVPDETGTGQGPLAGVLASLAWAQQHGFDHVATFPCDVPFFPTVLVERFLVALKNGVDCVTAQRADGKHPVFALWRVSCRQKLAAAFADGLRSLHAVDEVLACALVRFADDPAAPNGDPFFNINSVEDLARANALLEKRR